MANKTQSDETASASKRLTIVLRTVEGAWTYAVFEDARLRDRWIRVLREALAPLEVIVLSFLDYDDVDPLPILRGIAADADAPPVVMFTAVGRALPDLCTYLDLQRDTLARLPHRLVFWMTETERQTFVGKALNFTSRLNGVFRFPGTLGETSDDALGTRQERHVDSASSERRRPLHPVLSEKDRPRTAEYLRRRAHELEGHERPDPQVVADTWYDLGGVLEGGPRPRWAEVEAAYAQSARSYGRVPWPVAEVEALVHAIEAAFRADHPPAAEEYLGQALDHLRDVPAEDRWRLRAALADVFHRAIRPDRAFDLYEQAAAEAEEAGHWADVARISGNWAYALLSVGQLDTAKATYLRSMEALQEAGSPPVEVVGRELEMLRIDVMQGASERVLSEIERRLDTARTWWRRSCDGEPVPEAPNPVVLGRILMVALDITAEANRALKRWQACLELLEEIEEAERTLGEREHERARTRFNQYEPLLRLGRLDDAQRVLEGCLDFFHRVDDLTGQLKALGGLADLWDKRGDRVQAVALARQALAISNRLPDPTDRSISHGNLSNYLDRSGEAEEEVRHLMAAIVYAYISGHKQNLSVYLNNLALRAAPAPYESPRLADLLSRSEFNALRQMLDTHSVDAEKLQGSIDQLVEQVRQSVEPSES